MYIIPHDQTLSLYAKYMWDYVQVDEIKCIWHLWYINFNYILRLIINGGPPNGGEGGGGCGNNSPSPGPHDGYDGLGGGGGGGHPGGHGDGGSGICVVRYTV